jgi:NAD(P)-dependent dehydrogenase (short-subunit alcohol dehydrogenase family)
VRNPKQVEAMVKFTVDRFGRLDVLHNNNAFYTTVGAVGEMSIDGWLKTISVTLSGYFTECVSRCRRWSCRAVVRS